nr:uncharacterized protein LOC117276753 [Nicotiana tomentosiformis]
MSVRDYNMQFNSLAKYAPLVVAKTSDRVHRFVGCLGSHLINECTIVSLSANMDITRIQAYAQILEDRKRQQQDVREHDLRQHKRARATGNMGESRGDFRPPSSLHPSYPLANVIIQSHGQHRDRTTHFGQGQNPRGQSSQYSGDPSKMKPPTSHCGRCGRNHFGICLLSSDICYSCGHPGHIMRFCLVRNVGNMMPPTGSALASPSSPRHH